MASIWITVFEGVPINFERKAVEKLNKMEMNGDGHIENKVMEISRNTYGKYGNGISRYTPHFTYI